MYNISNNTHSSLNTDLNAPKYNSAENPSVSRFWFNVVIFEQRTCFSDYTTFNRDMVFPQVRQGKRITSNH